jgi:hypothetical protein
VSFHKFSEEKMNNWESRLQQIAREHADMAGPTGERLRATIARHTVAESVRSLQLAHARAREAVVTGTGMALRCGALLGDVLPAQMALTLRIACLSDMTAASYLGLAQSFQDLAATCARRNGRISEIQALRVLDRPHPDTVASLTALAGGHYVTR